MASSSSAAFSAHQRAASPAYQSMVGALMNGDSSGSTSYKQNLRHAEIMACASVDEIIKLIPDDYRIHLADHLRSAQKAVTQLCATRTTVAKWEHHRSVGTFPAQLRGSANQLQFTAGYKETAAAKAAQDGIDSTFVAYQKAVLDLEIAARKAEIVYLEEATAPGKATLDMRSALAPHCAAILERYKVPNDVLDPDGSVVDVTWVVNPQAEVIRDNVMADCGCYAQRAISIALNIGKQESLRIEKTKALAAKAQVAAADGDAMQVDATLSTTIKNEVKRQVMGVMQRDKPSRAAGPSRQTQVARGAAANAHAIVTGSGTGTGKKRSGPKPGKERVVVVAKVEGSQKPKRKRGRGKGKGKQQQQQVPMSEKRKGKQKAT
ncbi:hypothetical protein EDB83DRAFT_2327799 [Lactarius deliciosus]|nr:hypothetical protein EDB83DRAFT_2327799 [Lactarius deliciosus]